MSPWASLVLPLLLAAAGNAQTYSATYLPTNAPPKSEEGQFGTNQCGTGFNQTSVCQNAYINSVDDFCVWGPPEPGPGSTIGNIERFAVAYCLKTGYGTRLIPDGTITGAHFVQSPDFVQITGVGDFTKINIPPGDAGGEMDPHGVDGKGNPIGGLVFSSAFGQLQQIHEWTNFMGATQMCFRACKPGPNATRYCEHIYDVLGCAWNIPANYAPGTFERCAGDSGLPMGIYGTSTFYQGQPVTPPPHPAPSSSSCTSLSTIGNGLTVSGGIVISGPTSSSSSVPPRTTAPPASTGTNAPGVRATASASGAASYHAAVATGGTSILVCVLASILGML